jgi:superfamily II DNA or RNA helicase
LLDTAIRDTDPETSPEAEDEANEPPFEATQDLSSSQKQDYAERAKSLYEQYRTYEKRFHWLSSCFFKKDELKRDLEEDIKALRRILDIAGEWDPDQDPKLAALYDLLMKQHPNDKVLVFTQFADTALYLGEQLGRYGVDKLEVVTSDSKDPYSIARRFSPLSNKVAKGSLDELRVLITTDVLSEGQNLQDAHIVVNYDLPWAIIRLIPIFSKGFLNGRRDIGSGASPRWGLAPPEKKVYTGK